MMGGEGRAAGGDKDASMGEQLEERKKRKGPTFGVWRREMGVRCGCGEGDLSPSFNFNHNTRRHNAVTWITPLPVALPLAPVPRQRLLRPSHSGHTRTRC